MNVVVEYSHNNSGGRWWLTDADWKALEAAGWVVEWKVPGGFCVDDEGRFLGALATEATRRGLSYEDAIAEWARITMQDPDAEGCECCGPPHYFSALREAAR